MVDVAHERRLDPPGTLHEAVSIDRYNLRHVRHRVLLESGRASGQENVPGRVEESKIRRQNDGDDRRDATAIEGIILDDEHRPTISWLRAARLVQLGPPNFAALNYHSVLLTARR